MRCGAPLLSLSLRGAGRLCFLRVVVAGHISHRLVAEWPKLSDDSTRAEAVFPGRDRVCARCWVYADEMAKFSFFRIYQLGV